MIYEYDQAPQRVKVSPILATDVEVRLELTAPDKELRILLRALSTHYILSTQEEMRMRKGLVQCITTGRRS